MKTLTIRTGLHKNEIDFLNVNFINRVNITIHHFDSSKHNYLNFEGERYLYSFYIISNGDTKVVSFTSQLEAMRFVDDIRDAGFDLEFTLEMLEEMERAAKNKECASNRDKEKNSND